MASILSAGTTSGTALNMSGDTSGVLQLATNGTTTALTLDASQNATVAGTLTTTGITNSGVATGARFNPTGSSVTGNGMYLPAANSLGLSTNGANAVYIDSSQNVGIGTTSPVTKLTVTGGNGNAITSTNTGSQYSGFEIANNGTNKVTLQYDNTNGIAALNTRGANPFTFGTADTERMRINSTGKVLVGTTEADNPTDGIVLYFAAQNSQVIIGHATGTPSGYIYTKFSYNASTIGSITQNGTTAVAYNTSSDYRLKENIAPLTGALNKIAQLKPVTYTWKSAPDETGEGFIAHELAKVCPQAVHGTKDEVDTDGNPKYQGIDTSFLVATLTAAIQELKAINDTQAETINALTARIVALEQA